MKRYLAFYGDQYYPQGGWYDLLGTFDTVEAAFAELLLVDQRNNTHPEEAWVCAWAHIIDSTTGEFVWDDDKGYKEDGS